jgi:hypothetical protein
VLDNITIKGFNCCTGHNILLDDLNVQLCQDARVIDNIQHLTFPFSNVLLVTS